MTGSETVARRVALVTGASRGIGAETAKGLAATGMHVVVNYREKARRAQAVADDIVAAGGSASTIGADLSDRAAVTGMLGELERDYGRLDALVLNASGGLERDADPGYALRLNRDAQVHLATAALPLLAPGGRIVFITSHQAHFHGTGRPLPDGYEPIAASKRAGEDALRALIPEFARHAVGFTVVSGDMIDGTIIIRLLERRDPDAVAARRTAGPLPTVEDFAATVVRAVDAEVPEGHTYYVGGEDYVGAR
ncbi:SDR family oxidoreductase [Nocardia higoensis]|uniref:SDR family oxidoreductase n=1 Tax=Nocardia higoensis TaxID=228599 RepID=A0ABS0DHA7_9NOCA|nr:SDR family oxidoreductase [Nocardia higoensis]MBF6357855.1 SDR family oxidoreductase [Nocardia higoensis]